LQSFINWIYGIALTLGGPGLFAIAFLDSSFVSLPQINDVLVVLMVTKYKAWMPYYAAMATLGSVAGCYVIYMLAGKGGEVFLSRRLKGSSLQRILNLYRRHGLLALMVPALLPPPAPFKPESLSAPRAAGVDGARTAASSGTVQAVRARGGAGERASAPVHHGNCRGARCAISGAGGPGHLLR
jgi:membrane protein YqaA with SNARE-associated domain